MMTRTLLLCLAATLLAAGCENADQTAMREVPIRHEPVTAPGSEVKMLTTGYAFTEGPAADEQGNVYFTDIPNDRIYTWALDGTVSVYKTNTGGANGLFFVNGNLLAAAGDLRMVVMYPVMGSVQVLATDYKGERFNSPNDLWVDPQGGVYFTDPRYGSREGMEMEGEHVYYITPNRREVRRVIDDMVRPNGIIGTPEGNTLYVTDHGAGKTYRYRIRKPGVLTDKELFVEKGSDGMTLDEHGNLYLTGEMVSVYSPDGVQVDRIVVPERPSNVAFGGTDRQTLFITARESLYAIPTVVKGVY